MSKNLMPTLMCGENFLEDSKINCTYFTGLTTEYIEPCDYIDLYFGVRAYSNGEEIPFTISPDPSEFDTCTGGTYTFEYTADDYTESRTIVVVTKRTVLYKDGALIINELSTDSESNKAIHGGIRDSWTPWSETRPYKNGQDGFPWRLQVGNIVSVEFGSVVKPISMALWFQSTELMNIDFTNLDTSNTTSMAFLFDRCTKLKSVDMRGLDTSKVVSFNSMFDHSALENINMSMLDTSSVIRMNSMFNNCRNIVTLDITGWDTSKVESMEEMFYQCEMTELDLCSFSSESLDNTTNMFTENEELETIYVSSAFDCGNVSHSTGMFHNCIALVGGMGTSYDTNHKDKTYAKIDGGVGDEGYFTECN